MIIEKRVLRSLDICDILIFKTIYTVSHLSSLNDNFSSQEQSRLIICLHFALVTWINFGTATRVCCLRIIRTNFVHESRFLFSN